MPITGAAAIGAPPCYRIMKCDLCVCVGRRYFGAGLVAVRIRGSGIGFGLGWVGCYRVARVT
jgi:hypothetical protein